MAQDDKRFLNIRMLQLISEFTAKVNQLEAAGIKLEAMDAIFEELSSTLFQLNGIDPAKANGLNLSLADFANGTIGLYEFLEHLDGHCSVNTGSEGLPA